MNTKTRHETPPKAEHGNKQPIPDCIIEFYLLGELPEDELAALRALERDDAGFRARADAARAANEEILATYPPKQMAAIGMARAKQSGFLGFLRKLTRFRQTPRALKPAISWNWKIISQWAIPAFACAVALIVLPTRVFTPANPFGADDDPAGKQALPAGNQETGDRVKGLTPSIEVWRKLSESTEQLAPKAIARAGDIVQLRYAVPEPCYGALVSLDGRGVITVHLTGELGKAAKLTPGRLVTLGSAYRLDDAPKFETFYLITSAGKFDVGAAAESLKDGAKLPWNLQVTEFTLLKT